MDITERFRRLTIWNKLGAVGAIASVVGLVALAPLIYSFASERHARKKIEREATVLLARGDRLLEAGRVSEAHTLVAGARDEVRQEERILSFSAVVDGLLQIPSPSKGAVQSALHGYGLSMHTTHPLAAEVRVFLEYLDGPQTNPATFFRQRFAHYQLHRYPRILLAEKVHVADPEWSRALLESVLREDQGSGRSWISAKSHYWLGMLAQPPGKYSEAVKQFSEGIQHVPFDDVRLYGDLLERLTNAQWHCGDTEGMRQSLGELDELVKKDRTNIHARYQLALGLSRFGDPKGARQQLDALLDECNRPAVYNQDTWICEFISANAVVLEMESGRYSADQESRLKLALTRFATMPGAPYDETIAFVHIYLAKYYLKTSRVGLAEIQLALASEIRDTRRNEFRTFWPEEEWKQISELKLSTHRLRRGTP